MAAAYSSGASWGFPDDMPGQWTQDDVDAQIHGESWRRSSWFSGADNMPPEEKDVDPDAKADTEADTEAERRRRAHYKSRTCRICLEVVPPTFDMDETTSLFASAIRSKPRVTYASPPGDGGRMIRPCKCKGSQKYVHEECLGAWRAQDPAQKRNYWQCPTCRYKYQLQRLTWASWISSTLTQLGLTLLIFLTAIFLLGFIADPIINMYLTGTFFGIDESEGSYLYEDEPASWLEHCVKGLTSLGLLGFLKYVWVTSPWQVLQMRGFVGRGHAGATGRDRMNNFGWIAIMVGVFTFLWAVWKGVRAWSRRTLIQAGERVMDVHDDNDDDDDEE